MARVTTPSDVGALARAARTARGWNQQQAADAAGVSRRFVNLLEGGEHNNAELWRVLALLDSLGIHLVGSIPGSSSAGDEEAAPTPNVPSAPDGFNLDAHLSEFRQAGDSL